MYGTPWIANPQFYYGIDDNDQTTCKFILILIGLMFLLFLFILFYFILFYLRKMIKLSYFD